MKSIVFLSICLGVCYGALVPPRAIQGNCPEFCPQIFSPVCGSDGKEFRSFSNNCAMTVFNCMKSRDFQRMRTGLCEEDGNLGFGLLSKSALGVPPLHLKNSQRRCKPCLRIYLPVCGFDGEEQRVFGNLCEMNYVNCMESRQFALVREGEC